MIDERMMLEKTYQDKCDIYVLQDTEDVYGMIKQDWMMVHDSVMCALSKKSLNGIMQTEGEGIIEDSVLLFMDDRILVQKGCKVVCRGDVFYAGKPFVYTGSHQEIPLGLRVFA